MCSWVRYIPTTSFSLILSLLLTVSIKGYGDPSAPNTKRVINDIDFNDTFLDINHLKECFPDYQVRLPKSAKSDPLPPYKVKFPTEENDNTLLVQPYVPPNRGPYPYDIPKKNAIPFTRVQGNYTALTPSYC